MARNYKRDTRGRFARIAGQKVSGGSRFAPAKMTGRQRLALNARILAGPVVSGSVDSAVRRHSSTGVRKAPIQKLAKGRVLVAVDNKGNVRKVSATQARRIQANNRRIARGAAIGAIAGGYAGAHAGVLGVAPGLLLGAHIGAAIVNRSNQRRKR